MPRFLAAVPTRAGKGALLQKLGALLTEPQTKLTLFHRLDPLNAVIGSNSALITQCLNKNMTVDGADGRRRHPH